jgi:hypothetical protein
MVDSRSPQCLQEASLAFLDHARNGLQIFFANVARFNQVYEERFR